MRIKRLELINFRGFEEAAVDFPEENVVVFFGENGSGKTSILDAIGKLLYRLIKPNNFLRREPGFVFTPGDIMVAQSESGIIANLKYKLDKNSIKDLSTSIIITKSKVENSNANDENDFRLAMKNAEFADKSIPILVYYKTNREMHFGIEKHTDADYTDEPFGRILTYDKAFSATIDDFNDFEEWFRYQEDIENQEKIHKKDLDFFDPYLETVRKAVINFIKPFSDVSGDLKIKRVTNLNSYYSPTKEFSLVTTKNGQELRLSQLSSGERALMLLVADIARRAVIANPHISDPLQSEGIVLIDEIELHLHPKWQRKVIPALRKTFPNIQFIIATHSPQVLSNVENGSVFEIENFQIVPRSTYGRDNQWILEAVMDDEPRPVEIQDKLDKYFTLIRNGDLDEATKMRAELEELIGTDEPEFAKADILIRRKERNVSP